MKTSSDGVLGEAQQRLSHSGDDAVLDKQLDGLDTEMTQLTHEDAAVTQQNRVRRVRLDRVEQEQLAALLVDALGSYLRRGSDHAEQQRQRVFLQNPNK
ncbi:hypothetical protein GN244_ATG05125 [Phytophthora infestans]|uniref:Uncharacterized protein n=1 Tax=Phytophthora infestans TaxID=4787 RepID=A0A833WYR2_PHYIN|nr:hypothetical protein GN244_ATG05125 [Phytophthora infestans]